MDNWQQSGEIFGVSGAAPVYARRMIEDIRIEGQFFDESYFAYKEDVDVAWRARRWAGNLIISQKQKRSTSAVGNTRAAKAGSRFRCS